MAAGNLRLIIIMHANRNKHIKYTNTKLWKERQICNQQTKYTVSQTDHKSVSKSNRFWTAFINCVAGILTEVARAAGCHIFPPFEHHVQGYIQE